MQTATRIDENNETEIIDNTKVNSAGINYTLIGSQQQSLVIQLDREEKIKVAVGSMSWMTSDLSMHTYRSKLSNRGANAYLTDYECQRGSGVLAVTPTNSGKIVPINMIDRNVNIRAGSFLAAEKDINLVSQSKIGVTESLFRSQRIIMQEVTGRGLLHIVGCGEGVVYELNNGQELLVDPDNLLAFESGVQVAQKEIMGLANKFFGGEGYKVLSAKGSGKIWLQTHTLPKQTNNWINWLIGISGLLFSILFVVIIAKSAA